jgi:long-subunit fatty acid transport protein
MRRVLVAGALVFLAASLRVSSAHAGGIEYPGQGAEALGRGGATTARATDPMVLANNPAGLAELRGGQFMFNANLAVMDACVDPIGYYGWGVYPGSASSPEVWRDPNTGKTLTLPLMEPLDRVCMDQHLVPIPQLAWTARLSERLGIGAGLIFPAAMPQGAWGGRNGIVQGPDGTARPAASRYQMLNASTIGVFPTVGFGYRLFKQLRIGGAFEWGIIAVNNFTMSSAGGGTTPKNDIIAHIKAQDWFIPAFTVSAHVVPVDAIDIVLAFRWQDELKAKGDLDLTTGSFDPNFQHYTTGGLPITSLTQAFPWKLRGGIRYAARLAPRPVGTGNNEPDPSNAEVIHDALQDERWDIELDVEYQANAGNQRQVLKYTDPPPQLAFVKADGTMAFNDGPTQSVIEKHWKNQMSMRLGSTVNVLPGVVGIMGGVSYENRGLDPSYMQIDFWPVARIGVHGGVIVRVAKFIDLVASFAHIFQETITAEPPPHQARGEISPCWAGTATDPSVCLAPPGQIRSIDKSIGKVGADRTLPPVVPEPAHGKGDGTAKLTQQVTITAAAQPPYIINAGKYRSNIDVIAAGVNVHF